MEMKHADTYIDLSKFTDEELLEHPVFIHNFVMCILSIFVMTMYLIQTWILFDHWQWVRDQNERKKKKKLLDMKSAAKYFLRKCFLDSVI